MTGFELAALLKWPALASGGVFLVWLVRFLIRQDAKSEAKNEIRLEDYIDAQKERHDARQDYREDRAHLLNRWRARRRLRDRQSGGNPAA